MRYVLAVALFALAGCGSIEAYDNARSVSEVFYIFKKDNGLVSKEKVGRNPYDDNPEYKMVYCAKDGFQYWSTEAACLDAGYKPMM